MNYKTIINIQSVEKLTKKLKQQGQSIVLAGGCFDILHSGHVDFLEKSKKLGDSLWILLESDKNIRINKGIKRPINNQTERAKMLGALRAVDYVVMLPFMKTDKDYQRIINLVKPDVITLSNGDVNLDKKRQQAKVVGAKLEVIKKTLANISSSKILEMIESVTNL